MASAPAPRPATPAAINLASNATSSLAAYARLPVQPLAQSLSPMAHGNLLGPPRGTNRLHRFLAICVAEAGGVVGGGAAGGMGEGEAVVPETFYLSLRRSF